MSNPPADRNPNRNILLVIAGLLAALVAIGLVAVTLIATADSGGNGLSPDQTEPKPNLNEHVTEGPRLMKDETTGLSFPFPDKRWGLDTRPGPHNGSVLQADSWDCGASAICHHGLLASGGPVSGTDLATFAQQKGDDLHPRYIGTVQSESQLMSAATTVGGHQAWQIRWHVVSSDQGIPPATAWLLAIDSGAKGTGGVGEEYDWVYGAVDDNDPDLRPSVFDQVLKTIQIQPR